MNNFIAIDQGTTSTRAILFDEGLNILNIQTKKLKTIFPHSGWVEQKPSEIIDSVFSTVKPVMNDDVVGLGITNQRETVIVWDRSSGIPIYNAIVWQDRRTDNVCKKFKSLGYEDMVKKKTGLLLDPYFSASKISWILDNVKNARKNANDGKLAFGTIDTFILWHLTNGRVHATDTTNASRTMLFNISKKTWDDELLDLFSIPKSLLPKVNSNIANFSDTDLFGRKIPIKVMIGDQQAAAIGQGCFKPGMAKATFGTGCFVLLNTGKKMLETKSNLITTIAFELNGVTNYALEGSLFNVGTVIDWIKDNVKLIQDYRELDNLSNKDSKVVFIPAFTGLGAPYWNSNCRGAIFGLERNTDKDDLIKAALMSIAFQMRDLLSAMQLDYLGQPIELLRVDGGVSKNNWLMQAISDQLAINVQRPKNVEASAFGVAFLIGLSFGLYPAPNDISYYSEIDETFTPDNDKNRIDQDYKIWTSAIKALLN